MQNDKEQQASLATKILHHLVAKHGGHSLTSANGDVWWHPRADVNVTMLTEMLSEKPPKQQSALDGWIDAPRSGEFMTVAAGVALAKAIRQDREV